MKLNRCWFCHLDFTTITAYQEVILTRPHLSVELPKDPGARFRQEALRFVQSSLQ
jgi:hypothetical protein